MKKESEAGSQLAGQVRRVADLVEYQPGAVVSRQIMKTDGGSVTLFAFDGDQGLSEHTAPYDALVEVIEGEAEVTISGEAHTVGEGQMVLMPASVPHALKAIRRFKMVLTMVR